MELQMMYSILGYLLLLITSYRKVHAAAAYRLSDTYEKVGDYISNDRAITLKSAESPDLDILNHYIHTVPVHHFARHGLCRHEEGRQYFYRAMKSKLCQIQDTFVSDLVENLCRHRGSSLDKWVSELFDIDGDGMVNHFENQFYKVDG
ncbi:uncharacterized protein LOC123539374 [Mercenaria mercenaria]|uniref:uncharacterized protein LOC123539374 n=1 Tax=Mercenaria mercenaria TaxID=6596 RepID=UPI00234F8EC3|nr:uncharacterized protein LOC123539374 [Mercenaria mercenaria]